MYAPRPVSCSLLHLLCRFPLLVVPVVLGVMLVLPYISNIPERCIPAEAMITFTFDDGYTSTYTKALPVLEKYGYTATVFVTTSLLGQPGYLTRAQLLDLAGRGWEIGSHTVTHPNLTELSEAELLHELIVSKQYLTGLGLAVESFSSPYGQYNDRVIAAIAQVYASHRTAWPDGLNDIPVSRPEDRYYLKAVSVETSTTVEEVKQWILKAKAEGKWLILLFHQIDAWGDYNWSLRNFETVVRFISEQGFKGVPMSLITQ